MLMYRAIRAVHRGYPLTVFWLYVCAFLFSLPFLFLMPQVTLALLGLGLAGLVWVAIGEKLLGWSERLAARRALRHGSCPHCGSGLPQARDASAHWQCEVCGRSYLPTGAEWNPMQDGICRGA